MASKGIRDTNDRKLQMAIAQRAKRHALMQILADSSHSYEERLKAAAKLNKNRNASLTRRRRRSKIDGRPRAVVHGEINRIEFRLAAGWGLLPGVTKASW